MSSFPDTLMALGQLIKTFLKACYYYFTALIPKQRIVGSSKNLKDMEFQYDEVPTGNEVTDSQGPKGALKRFRAARERIEIDDDVSMDGATARKKKLTKKPDLFTGGQESDSETQVDDDEFDFKNSYANASPKHQYAGRCKELALNKLNVGRFFSQREFVSSFGISSIIKMRLGKDVVNHVWKLYMKKENPNAKPSILQILFAELDEIFEYLQDTLAKIEIGLETGQKYLRPENLATFKQETPDTLSFWQHPNVWYSGTGVLRIRVLWQFSDNYQFIFNVGIDGSSYEKYFGPKIRLGVKEVRMFIDKAKAIQASVPAWDELD